MDQANIVTIRALRRVRRLRELAYPPMADYLDGVVKATADDPAVKAAGQAQIEAYCVQCRGVKQRYSKPVA